MSTRKLYDATSAYQRIYVGQRGDLRFMRFGDYHAGWQGAVYVKHPHRLYFGYQQAFSLFSIVRSDVSRFLSVGVGTGTAISHVHHFYPRAKLVGIELDPDVLSVAKSCFFMPMDERVQLVTEDARTCVPKLADAFDLIFVDVFFHERTPAALLSPIYLRVLSDILMDGGVAVFNVIMSYGGSDREVFGRLCTDLKALIGPVFYIPLGMVPYLSQNIVVFACKDARLLSEATLKRNAVRYIEEHQMVYGFKAKRLPYLLKVW